jgi:hypothetical protein
LYLFTEPLHATFGSTIRELWSSKDFSLGSTFGFTIRELWGSKDFSLGSSSGRTLGEGGKTRREQIYSLLKKCQQKTINLLVLIEHPNIEAEVDIINIGH